MPVLFALEQNGKFAKRWQEGPITQDEVNDLAALLEKEGGKAYAEKTSADLTAKALGYLDQAAPQGEAGEAIRGLANMLLKRKQ